MIGLRLELRFLPAAVAALGFALVVPAAGHPGAAGGADLQVPRDAVTTIVGPSFAAGFPRSAPVADAGDVNGDGRRDLLYRNVQGHGGDEARNYLLYGGKWPSLIRLPIGGTRGFAIPGEWVAAVGDVNGDGRADLASSRRLGVGPAFVLFGRIGRRAAAKQGFRVDGGWPGRAGDIDGDGFDDLLVDPYTAPVAATVVFGHSRSRTVDAARPRSDGFRITPRFAHVAAVGDVNGDARADVVVGPFRSTRLLVVFGRRRSGTVDATRRGLPAIASAGAPGYTRAVASAGDVNGDGIGDLVVGVVHRRACIVLGRRGPWPAMTSCGGPGSVVVDGAPDGAAFGAAVGSAGDLDRDGYGDFLVSAPGERVPGSELASGAVYVVYGRDGARRIDVASDSRVVRIAAAPVLRESIGSSIAAAGDLTGDGVDDVVITADLSGDGWVVSPRVPSG